MVILPRLYVMLSFPDFMMFSPRLQNLLLYGLFCALSTSLIQDKIFCKQLRYCFKWGYLTIIDHIIHSLHKLIKLEKVEKTTMLVLWS